MVWHIPRRDLNSTGCVTSLPLKDCTCLDKTLAVVVLLELWLVVTHVPMHYQLVHYSTLCLCGYKMIRSDAAIFEFLWRQYYNKHSRSNKFCLCAHALSQRLKSIILSLSPKTVIATSPSISRVTDDAPLSLQHRIISRYPPVD